MFKGARFNNSSLENQPIKIVIKKMKYVAGIGNKYSNSYLKYL